MEFTIAGFRHDAGRVSEICEATIGRWIASSAGGGHIRLHDDLTDEEARAVRAALEEAAKEEPVDPRLARRAALLDALEEATTLAQLRTAVKAALAEALR